MATSKLTVTPGIGANVATYSITEDGVTKDIGRIVLTTSAGVEITALPVVNSTGTLTETCPSVATATSVQLLAANASRKYLLIQNNSAGNVMVSLSGNALTGIVPTATNKGVVLLPGASVEPNLIPTTAITCYQTSGSTINLISVVEG